MENARPVGCQDLSSEPYILDGGLRLPLVLFRPSTLSLPLGPFLHSVPALCPPNPTPPLGLSLPGQVFEE